MVNNSENGGLQNDVRERLLDAAEKLFAEKGYPATSVRDITSEADCNIAAINYHFGGKENLYHEVFRRKMGILRDRRVDAINSFLEEKTENACLEDFIRMYANAFFEPIIDQSVPFSFFALSMREMVEKRLAHTMFLDQVVGPILLATKNAILKLVPQLTDEQAVQCSRSINAQLIHVIRNIHMAQEHPNSALRLFPLEESIEHIVKFSAAGIRAIADGGQK